MTNTNYTTGNIKLGTVSISTRCDLNSDRTHSGNAGLKS